MQRLVNQLFFFLNFDQFFVGRNYLLIIANPLRGMIMWSETYLGGSGGALATGAKFLEAFNSCTKPSKTKFFIVCKKKIYNPITELKLNYELK